MMKITEVTATRIYRGIYFHYWQEGKQWVFKIHSPFNEELRYDDKDLGWTMVQCKIDLYHFKKEKYKWKASMMWWGQAEIVRECPDVEWDGNLTINGVPHLCHPYHTGYFDSDDAQDIVDQLNGDI